MVAESNLKEIARLAAAQATDFAGDNVTFESKYKTHVGNMIEMSLLHALQNLEKANLERERDLLDRIKSLEREIATLKSS